MADDDDDAVRDAARRLLEDLELRHPTEGTREHDPHAWVLGALAVLLSLMALLPATLLSRLHPGG